MASLNTTGLRAFPNGPTALSAFTRVTLTTAGVLACAGPTGHAIGFLDLDSESNVNNVNALGTVRLATCPGTRKGIADTAITAYGYVYASLSGYLTSASGVTAFSTISAQTLGIALPSGPGQTVAATALGSVFEFAPLDQFV